MMNETSYSVVVVGAGGNIGSHLVPHLGRMPGVDRITLIDKDVYETSNLLTQDIAPRDVGKRKASVQARRLKRINPRIRIDAITDAVERVPVGKLRGDVILSCLDSRIARQHINQFAWRLGVPLIDAGVEPSSMLARVNVYIPGAENPCLECAWDDRDYAALEQTYPCQNFVPNVTATNAPSSLGALAASLLAIECRKLIAGQLDLLAVSKQVLIDASHHKQYVTAFRRNLNCRFSGHEVWDIRRLNRSPENVTLGEALRLGPSPENVEGSAGLRVENKPFASRLTCPSCGRSRKLLRLAHTVSGRRANCPGCGQRMLASGFDLIERVDASAAGELSRSLRSLGLRAGDVFSVGDGRECHYELTVERSERAEP